MSSLMVFTICTVEGIFRLYVKSKFITLPEEVHENNKATYTWVPSLKKRRTDERCYDYNTSYSSFEAVASEGLNLTCTQILDFQR